MSPPPSWVTIAGVTPADRIAYAFRLTTGRKPNAKESEVLASLYDDERARFAARPAAAAKLLTVGEARRDGRVPVPDAAAYAVVASTLLSMDEAVNKR